MSKLARTLALWPVAILVACLVLADLIPIGLANAAPGGSSGGAGNAGGGANTGGGGTGGGAAPAGGAPTAPSSFFSQNSVNFARPAEGWVGDVAPSNAPTGTVAKNTRPSEATVWNLCYQFQSPTGDAIIPYLLRRVTSLPRNPRIPCYGGDSAGRKRPMLRGDRMRIVVDVSDDSIQTFLPRVSVINLNVSLQIAPPLIATVLRTNLAGTSTTAGLGGAPTVEIEDIGLPFSCRHFLENVLTSRASDSIPALTQPGNTPCAIARTLPSSVSPLNSLKAQVTLNLQRLQANASAALTAVTQDRVQIDAFDGSADPSVVQQRKHYSDAKTDLKSAIDDLQSALDGVLVLPWPYALPGDVLPTITISALYTVPESGAAWHSRTLYPVGSIVQCPTENACALVSIASTGQHGIDEPPWPDSPQTQSSQFETGDILWGVITPNYRLSGNGVAKNDGTPAYSVDDQIVWTQGATQEQTTIKQWQQNTHYGKGVVILCPPSADIQNAKVCVSLNAGNSGPAPTGNAVWGAPSGYPRPYSRWRPTVGVPGSNPPRPNLPPDGQLVQPYSLPLRIRCEAPSQKLNLCAASVGGWSGASEPWWSAAPSSTSSAPPSVQGGQTPAVPQRDYQIIWSALTPTTGTAASDQVLNMVTEEIPQTHSPALWGLAVGFLHTTSQIPSAYAFSTQPAAPCTACTNLAQVTAEQKAGDIVLMISPYASHLIMHQFNHALPEGIDTESSWQPLDAIPEPAMGFGLNTLGASYYLGISSEIGIRNFEIIAGRGWIKGTSLTNPVVSSGSAMSGFTPNTFSRFFSTWYIGFAYNIAGLVAGH